MSGRMAEWMDSSNPRGGLDLKPSADRVVDLSVTLCMCACIDSPENNRLFNEGCRLGSRLHK